jgi:hypothetical protein
MQQTFISLGISILYPILVTMIIDKLIGYETEYFQNKSVENGEFYNNNNNDDVLQKRYYLLTFIGVLSIIGGNYIKEQSISNGISLGGLFLLIFHTLFNWFSIDQTTKIVVLSISLGALLYTGKNKKFI